MRRFSLVCMSLLWGLAPCCKSGRASHPDAELDGSSHDDLVRDDRIASNDLNGDTAGDAAFPPLGCVSDWPPSNTPALDESLGDGPSVLWRLPLSSNDVVRGGVATIPGAVAISAPFGVDIVMLPGRSVMSFSGLGTAVSRAVFDRVRQQVVMSDRVGNFAIDLSGKVVWQHRAGPNLSKQEFAAGSAALIDDDDGIYIAGVDGDLVRLDAVSGSETWRARVGLSFTGVANAILAGVGNAVFVTAHDPAISGSAGNHVRGHDRRTGRLLGVPADEFDSWRPTAVLPIPSGGLIASGIVDATGASRLLELNTCGVPQWRITESLRYAGPVEFGYQDDMILINQPDGVKWPMLIRYSKTGTSIASFQLSERIVDISIGSDDWVYVLACAALNDVNDEGLSLVAMTPEFSEKWRLPLPGSRCVSAGRLAEDGIYYVARGIAGPTNGRELVAIQTTSRGGASSAVGYRWLGSNR